MGSSNEHVRADSANKLLVGFDNKTQTLCYANSILQVLFHHPIFASIVEDIQQLKGVLYHLRELLGQMYNQKRMHSVSTTKLMSYVQNASESFERQRHQDSHEFYIWLMNSINDQIKLQYKNKNKKGPTPLEEQFYSKRVTRTECLKCHNVTEREEEEVDLSLILPEPNVSLIHCISHYSKPEIMKGSNQFKCDKCNSLQDAEKKSLLKTLPRFLCIHLKRFQFDETKNCLIKLLWSMPFPFMLKVKTNYDPDSDVTGRYRLVGVVAHYGRGENYGHYVSYIKIGQVWYIFNDDEITEVEDYMLEALWGYKGVSNCAYMLFYSL